MAKRPTDIKVRLDRLAEKSHERVPREPCEEALNSKESPKEEGCPKKKQTLGKQESSKKEGHLKEEKKEGTFGTEIVKKWKASRGRRWQVKLKDEGFPAFLDLLECFYNKWDSHRSFKAEEWEACPSCSNLKYCQKVSEATNELLAQEERYRYKGEKTDLVTAIIRNTLRWR